MCCPKHHKNEVYGHIEINLFFFTICEISGANHINCPFIEFGLPVGINSSFVPDSCKVEFVAAFLYGRFIRLIFQSKKTVQSVRHQFQLVYFAARSLMFRGKLSLCPPIVFRKDHERNRCSWFSCTKGSGNYCRLARSCA